MGFKLGEQMANMCLLVGGGYHNAGAAYGAAAHKPEKEHQVCITKLATYKKACIPEN